jgi:hypothetical protein
MLTPFGRYWRRSPLAFRAPASVELQSPLSGCAVGSSSLVPTAVAGYPAGSGEQLDA